MPRENWSTGHGPGGRLLNAMQITGLVDTRRLYSDRGQETTGLEKKGMVNQGADLVLSHHNYRSKLGIVNSAKFTNFPQFPKFPGWGLSPRHGPGAPPPHKIDAKYRAYGPNGEM